MPIGQVGEFDPTGGTWSSYQDRIEMYFKVNDVKEELKLPTLIAMMGNQAYELLVNLASPKKPSELAYSVAVEIMRGHLQPTPSVLAERYRFRQRRQATDESITTYVAELQRLARYCDFGSNLDTNLRDQFVCGLGSDYIRQRLFAEDINKLTYKKAVTFATSLEVAERESAAVEVSIPAGDRAGTMGAKFGGGPAAVHALAISSARTDQVRGWRGGRVARGARGARMSRGGGGGAAGALQSDPGDRKARRSSTRCGGCLANEHDYASCPYRNFVCSRCRRVGHLRRACQERGSPGSGGQSSYNSGRGARMYYNEAEGGVESEPEAEVLDQEFHHLCLNDYKAVSLPISIEGQIITMEVDSGSAVSCISLETYEQHFKFMKIDKCDLNLKFYDGSKVKPIGVIRPLVRHKNICKQLELFIIDGGTTSLLGRQWLAELDVDVPKFTACHNVHSKRVDKGISDLISRYKELFSGGLGRYTGGKASLKVREGATPVFHRARPLPYALQERVDAELDAMLRDGVIEPVDASDWASPLVPVNKPDGSLRLCADYKATVNPVLLTDRYPLPRIDDVMVRLSGACFFSKIDLSQAYNQIELDESKKYTVINTHRGLFRYNRLVYGLSSSAGIFQRTMCNLLQGIPNVEIFLDDVIIGGKNKDEHLQALEAVFKGLHSKGLKLKTKKCVFLVDEVQYLGYVISKEGIKTDPSKIEAITKIPRPSCVTELRSFLGLINFYAKFVKNFSSKLVPLYELLKKGKSWLWTRECEHAFIDVKNLLTSAEVLVHYDPNRPLIVTCDASGKGIGGVLTQPSADGCGERPVAYASRSLNDAEKNYSQIHREALAIIFSMNKFHQYLYGRRFTLRTDHKPLVSIFGPNTGIPAMVASRMQRWAIILSAYTFDIEYVRTDKNGADGLSRLPVISSRQCSLSKPEQTYLHFVQQSLLLDYNMIKRQTAKDPQLSRILGYIREGWPQDCEISSLKPFYNRSKELYEELGCVMWGHRLVVPEGCRQKVLVMLNEPHMGIVKSKSLARSYVWWPGVDEAVERMCRECVTCASQADSPPRQAPSMWPWPNIAWSRLHLDFMGPISGKTYLVVVDAMSKWVEVFHMGSTVANEVINKLCELFSRFGLPRQIVSDNGPPFTSREFKMFIDSCGIEHIFTAPYHPASNGLAENAVKTLKRVIKKAQLEGRDISRALWNFLLHYRNTEHATTGESPAMLMLKRKVRTHLDVIKPDRVSRVHTAQKRQSEQVGGADRMVEEGQDVWYRQYLKREKWAPGKVRGRLGQNDFSVVGIDGSLVHRHIEQLRKRSSRSSLACAVPIETNMTPEGNREPDSPAGGQSEVSAGTGSPVTPSRGMAREEGVLAGSRVKSLSSPEWNFGSPESSPPVASPQARPLRQCRLRNKPNYKV